MTTENNSIIAKFMNAKVTADTYFINGMYMQINEEDLKYHLDWNWLIEVVEKIETVKIENYKVRVDIYLNCCQICPTHWEILINICGDKDTTKIEAVYNACLKFINWYNETK